jgi:acid phosphatase (class A)
LTRRYPAKSLPRFAKAASWPWAIALAAIFTTLVPCFARESALNYLKDGQPDVASVLPPPPALDSIEQSADLDEVRTVYHAASSNDMAAAYGEKKFSVFYFAAAAGTFFVETNLPRTAAFFKKVQQDAETVTARGKQYFHRPRPYTTDPSLANGKLETSFGYPSGHSTESMVLALVLADLLPDKSAAILAQARMIGWHRVQIARHYATDIYAGRVLAQAIVHYFNKNEAYARELAEVRREIQQAQSRHGSS